MKKYCYVSVVFLAFQMSPPSSRILPIIKECQNENHNEYVNEKVNE